MSEDNKHGKGISIDGQGNSYEGGFVNGKMEGKGKYTFKSGNTEGDFIDGKKHGRGYLYKWWNMKDNSI